MTPFDLTGLLLLLGDTPDQVADSIRQAGIRGRRSDSDCCALANWLRHYRVPDPLVSPDRVTYGHLVDVDLPDPVRRFVAAFDDGHYPTLETEAVS